MKYLLLFLFSLFCTVNMYSNEKVGLTLIPPGKISNEELKNSGFIMINDGLRCMWTPTEANILECINFGKEIAKDCQE